MRKNSDYSKLGEKLLKEISELQSDELFEKIANFYSDNEEHAKRLYSYFKNRYLCPSTPVISNVPENGKLFKGLPISCFVNEVLEENVEKILTETIHLSKAGGGLATNWSKFPSLYDQKSTERNSFGIIPFAQLQGKTMRLTAGVARKVGSLCIYLKVEHADILNFIKMRKNAQGIDNEFFIPRYIHHAIVISDEFMHSVINNQDWFLYNKDNIIVNKIKARDLWMEIITIRTETGEPYLLFIDNANKGLTEYHKRLGLNVTTSNLCTEILLITGKDQYDIDRTAICALSSVNLAFYDEWKNIDCFIEDIARFMDNLLTYFIVEGTRMKIGDIVNYEEKYGLCNRLRLLEEDSVKKAFSFNLPIANAVYSCSRSRDIGVGAAGWHTLLQLKNIPFESQDAIKLNKEIFKFIREKFDEASKKLADERGACLDAKEFGIQERFSYKLAIAPTSQISSIMGVSKCIEADDPVYLNKNQAGFHLIKNPILQDYFETKGINNHETWMKIASEGLENFLSKDMYDVFKGPYDINPISMVNQVADRPIDQSQAFTLFFQSPMNMNLLLETHMKAWKDGVKTMYYLRSTEKIKASKSIITNLNSLQEENLNDCLMCQ